MTVQITVRLPDELADVAILCSSPGDPDLDGLAEYAGAHPTPLDD